jgi:rSAM/selenodomain-associated transferase 2
MMEPELSIIIPVLHEGDRIGSCLDHLARIAEDIPYEVIVSDGDPQGSTLSAIAPKLDYIAEVRSPVGRGAQLNIGAKAARGKVLLFLHVDACLPVRALHQVLETCEQQKWVGGAFDLAIASPRLSLKAIAKLASWRSRLTRIPYGDQAIFLRRDIFEQVQGYLEIPIMEDVALMQCLKRHGYAIEILPSAVTVSPRRWEKEGILRCTLRNWSLMTMYSLGVHPQALARWYRPQSSSKSIEARHHPDEVANSER